MKTTTIEHDGTGLVKTDSAQAAREFFGVSETAKVEYLGDYTFEVYLPPVSNCICKTCLRKQFLGNNYKAEE